MTTFKEFILSFLEASRERLKNPAVGAFVLTWISINWRFVAILFFSDSLLEERINLIEECYLTLPLTLWYPLITTGIYLLVLPNLMAVVDSLTRWAINLRKHISNALKLKDILAKQEIAVEERQLELIEEGSPDISKLNERMEILEKEKQELLSQLNDKKLGGILEQQEKAVEKRETEIVKEGTQAKKRASKKSLPKKTNTTSESKPTVIFSSSDHPSMRDNVVRNIAKSEKEWILLYGFYASNFGEKEFLRDDILAAYDETKRRMDSRIKNLSNNLNNLVKQGLIRYLNDKDMFLTDQGKELAMEILNR